MTKQCNWISPILMEALQILKFFFKKAWLNFINGCQILVDVNDNDILTSIVETSLATDAIGLQGALSNVIYFIGDKEGAEPTEFFELCLCSKY